MMLPVLYHLICFAAIALFSITARMHIRGRHNIPRQGPFIVASNHISSTDIPMVAQYIPEKVVYMAKEESFDGRVGWLVRFLGAFPVKRGEGDRRAIKAADEQLKKGKIFVIFPEGTRSKVHALGKAHAGLGMIALRSGVPVISVAIWGSESGLENFSGQISLFSMANRWSENQRGAHLLVKISNLPRKRLCCVSLLCCHRSIVVSMLNR